MTRAIFLIALVFVFAAATAAAHESKPATVILTVAGMHCEGCASGISAMLKRTDGVLKADVSFDEQRATVDYDSAKTSIEKIIEAVEKLGYKVSVKTK